MRARRKVAHIFKHRILSPIVIQEMAKAVRDETVHGRDEEQGLQAHNLMI
jgi:hypothetical protein